MAVASSKPSFKATIASCIAVGVGFVLFPHAASAATVVGGYTFNDNAFADSLIKSTGSFTTSGGTLQQVLTDNNPATYAFSNDTGASVELGFTDNVAVNLLGPDLALFELGIPDSFKVTIAGVTKSYLSSATGFFAGGFSLNAATIDLSDFGLAANSSINSLIIGLDQSSSSSTTPSLSLVGALNSATPTAVPTPALLPGLIGLGASVLRKRKAEAAKATSDV